MVICPLPTAALAAGESGIQLGTSGLKAKDVIYFGNYTDGTTYDVPWIVMNKSADEAFLLSKYLLGDSTFRGDIGYYSGGTLNKQMDALYSGTGTTLFTLQEREAIAVRTNLSCVDEDNDNTNSPAVSTAYLYPLSSNEAAALTWGSDTLKAPYITNQSGYAGMWWLRSSYDENYAVCVYDETPFNDAVIDPSVGVRPACNLDLSKVLFTSVAAGGKSSGAEGAGALNSNLTPSSTNKNTWKLTLNDSSRSNFSIVTKELSATNAVLAYSGAKMGTNEYISAMVVDNGSVTYYGRVKNLTSATDATGTITVNIPTGVTLDADTTLRIFNEQFNGDNTSTTAASNTETDYASELLTVAEPFITVWPDTLPNGTENTGYTAELTAKAAGSIVFDSATYSVVSGALPTGLALANQAGNNGKATLSGTPMAAGTYTFTIQAEVNTGNTPKPTGQRTYTVTIAAAPLVFTDSPDYDVPAGTVGTAITPIDVSGGASGGSTPYKFSLENAPGWLSITESGVLSGTRPASATAEATATIKVTDSSTPAVPTSVTINIGAVTAAPTPQSPIFTQNVIAQSDIPVTGDNNILGLWIGIALLTLAGFAAGIVIALRKRKA